MHPDVEKLISLQALDLELKRVTEERDAQPRHVSGLAARSAAAQAAVLTLEEKLATEEKLRRRLASDAADQRQRLARARRQMDVVTNAQQAGALEHEISFAAGEITRLEDAELETMERTETLETELAKAQANAAAAEATLERDRLRAGEIIDRTTARMAELNALRAELRPSIGEAVLGTYDRVARSRGTGLAEGVDGKCSACQMMVRPQKWNELRDRSDHDQIFTCDSCGRLLYWDPARDAPQKKPAEREESIAARIVRSL